MFFMQHSCTFHIWKCALDPENHAQYGHQPSPILSLIFFLILWLFYCYFSFNIATISIFGNVRWTLNTMVTNHPLFFSPFFLIFSLFYCYFSFSIATLSIFGSVHWTLKTQCPIRSPTIPHFFPYFFLIFSLFYCYFSLSIATLSIFGSAH